MNPQKIARVTGVLFLITYITSIPAFFVFYPPVLDDPRYIVGAGADTSVSFGAFLELVLIIANIGTAVVLFPILKRVNEILALGYVTARVVECVFITVGLARVPEGVRYAPRLHNVGPRGSRELFLADEHPNLSF